MRGCNNPAEPLSFYVSLRAYAQASTGGLDMGAPPIIPFAALAQSSGPEFQTPLFAT